MLFSDRIGAVGVVGVEELVGFGVVGLADEFFVDAPDYRVFVGSAEALGAVVFIKTGGAF